MAFDFRKLIPWRRPPTKPLGRTGEQRYAAPGGSGKDRRPVQAQRLDSISIRQLDEARFYPVVRDAFATIRTPVTRANFHFACADPVIADLAMQELGGCIRPLLQSLMRGALEFGYQVVEKRWTPKFDVTLTTGQAGSGQAERFFPFIWTIRRFASFDPSDTRLQVNTRTGDFAGVIQHIGGGPVVPASRCIHFVNDQEFDGLYGVARTKAAIPYIELAKSIYDDMALYSRRFAVPYRKGRYKPGFYVAGEGENGDEIRGENGDLLNSYLAGMESGQDVALPSEFHESGNPYWDIEFLQATGEDSYIEKLAHVNDMIRMAVVVPEMASSSSPDTGTYNLGETQIDLFLENIEAYLDQCKEVIDAQLLRDFVFYNFGPGSPPLTIVFEPINAKVKAQLLNGLIAMLTQGVPISDADGNEMNVDWPKLAQDNGVPVSMAPVRSIADQLRSAAEQRMAELSEVRLEQARDPDGKFASGPGGARGGKDPKETDIRRHPEFTEADVVNGEEPTGYGLVGPQYSQFSGAPEKAIRHLLEARTGEVPGALSHPEIGPIDLVFGGPKFGLMHIAEKHPEVLGDLQQIIATLPVSSARSSGESYWMENDAYRATVKKNWGIDKAAKTWLLTAFEKKGSDG